MLEQLVIRNFAIIDDLTVTFGPGLNALTGETGAGKSILIDALGMVLGGRADATAVRTGAQRATIDATFHLDGPNSTLIADMLTGQGIEMSEPLLLTREIQASGRSSARINGRPVTVGTLGMFGELLVDIHGQSDHLSLLRRDKQREILDAFGVDPALTEEVATLVQEWRRILGALRSLSSSARETAQRVDLLSYQLEEIDATALTPGEDTILELELARLSQVDKLAAGVAQAHGLIDAADSADGAEILGSLPSLRAAVKILSDAAQIDRSLDGLVSQLLEAQYLLDEASLDVRRYLDALEADPDRLEVVSDRLARIRDLKRKYGATIDEILAYREEAAAELDRLVGAGFDEESLKQKATEQERLVRNAVGRLTAARVNAARDLTAAVQETITDLHLGNASFSVAVRHRGEFCSDVVDRTGIDDIEFLFAPNEGEDPKPLARIASGGEMARVMLALKATLAAADSIPTYVFDEVDVGVGGRSGGTVGEKLRALARDRQVLVISHLPQVAAYASQHFRIRKQVLDGRTRSVIEELDRDERIEELAAMVDGEPVTEASRANALHMLERIALSVVGG